MESVSFEQVKEQILSCSPRHDQHCGQTGCRFIFQFTRSKLCCRNITFLFLMGHRGEKEVATDLGEPVPAAWQSRDQEQDTGVTTVGSDKKI